MVSHCSGMSSFPQRRSIPRPYFCLNLTCSFQFFPSTPSSGNCARHLRKDGPWSPPLPCCRGRPGMRPAIGDPALDLGNFLAHLRFRACQSPDRANTTLAGLAGRKAFTLAYQSTSPALWSRVLWWESASLLRLVCVYSLRTRWQELAVHLLGLLEYEALLKHPALPGALVS